MKEIEKLQRVKRQYRLRKEKPRNKRYIIFCKLVYIVAEVSTYSQPQTAFYL
jgi:hypothetical protein